MINLTGVYYPHIPVIGNRENKSPCISANGICEDRISGVLSYADAFRRTRGVKKEVITNEPANHDIFPGQSDDRETV